jgi:DNA invertase Pin-like site-specific DNA recombinase
VTGKPPTETDDTTHVVKVSEPVGPPRVAAYLVVPCGDPTKAALLQEQLAALQRSLGTPLGTYAEKCEDRHRRPLRARLLRRGGRGGFDLLCVVTLQHLATTRSRVAQLVLRLGVPVVTLSGLRLDPADRVVRWIAKERDQHRQRIRRALAKKRQRGERAGAIPAGYKLAADGLHIEPDPDVQRAITIARQLSAEGLALRKIARHLTDAGYRTRVGGDISHKQVKRWLARARSDGVSQLDDAARSRDS